MGQKIVSQKNYWSDKNKTDGLERLNPNVPLPESPGNILTAVDCFDLPVTEKAPMESAVTLGAKNDTNI